MRRLVLWICCLNCAFPAAGAEITRIWLTHQTNDPSRIVVNWESPQPGDSTVYYRWSSTHSGTISATSGDPGPALVAVRENVTLHHVEIPLAEKGVTCTYSVATGADRSAEATFKGYATDVLRVAVVADWQSQPKLDAILKDDVHLLLTAGDNIACLHRLCGEGGKDCTRPYAELIDAYPQLFRTTPFMPVLGNHDREIRPRGAKRPAEPVYDVEATAFRKYFPLPDDGWKWRFDLPDFGLRLVALDLNHISDMGTTWQTCHPFDKDSEQFQWYEKLMAGPKPPLVVTLYNERNASIRAKADGAWHQLFRQGTLAVTGFGYFAERAEVDGFTYYNTSLSRSEEHTV